jgi:hypothetical protein
VYFEQRATFNLTFDRSLNLDALTALYEQSPHIERAGRNSCWVGGCGREHNGGMWILSKGDDLHFVFARGWGGCAAGCAHCEYTYYTYSGGSVTVVDQLPDREVRRFTRWNIPAEFAATSFDGLDDLLAHFDHDDWWVRRHALEAVGDLLTSLSPQYPADRHNRETWSRMQALAHQRRAAIVECVTTAMQDTDADVASAARSLHELLVPQEVVVAE